VSTIVSPIPSSLARYMEVLDYSAIIGLLSSHQKSCHKYHENKYPLDTFIFILVRYYTQHFNSISTMNSKMNLYTSLSILFFMIIGNLAFASIPEPPEFFLHDFAVYNVEEEIVLEWFTNKESDIEYFIIERATGNSKFFKKIGEIRVDSDSQDAIYLYSDENPDLYNHYRIKIVLENGITLTSNTLKAHNDGSQVGKNAIEDHFKSKG